MVNMIRKKGQSAIEFFILVAAAFFIFVGLVTSVYISIEQKNYEKRDIVIRDVASTLNDEINLAHSSTDGYFRRFDIPQDILGIDYNISINSNDIYIITEDDKHALSITTLNVTGQPQTGQNTIKKESGSVRLN